MINITIKKDSINIAMIFITVILSFLSLFISALTVPCLMINFIIVAALCIFNFWRYSKTNIIVLFLLTVASMGITNAIHTTIGSTLIILTVFLIAILFNNIELPIKQYNKIRITISVLLVFYIVTCNNTQLMYRNTTFDLLGNLVNGNHLGILALIVFYNISILISEHETKKRIVFIQLVTAAICGYYVYVIRCRTALLSMAIYLVLLFFKPNPFSLKQYKTIIRTELIMCFLFPIIYIQLSSKLTNVQLVGKALFSGRQILWQSGFELIKRYPLFGSGNDFMYSLSNNEVISSSHNFMLGVIKMFGIIPAIAIMYVFPLRADGATNMNRITQFVVISALIIGFTEASFIEAHSSLFLMLLLLQYRVDGNNLKSQSGEAYAKSN